MEETVLHMYIILKMSKTGTISFRNIGCILLLHDSCNDKSF